MKRFFLTALSCIFFIAAFAVVSNVCAEEDLSAWKLPVLPVPPDNPQTVAKIALGRQLIFDPRLSKNDSIACTGCHMPAFGGAGPTPRAFGHGGELGRWAPTWFNSAYSTSLFWDGRASSLEEQTGALPGHMGPITAPGEMGADMLEVVKKLNAIPAYRGQFNAVFGTDATPENIAKAIGSYERTLIAFDAPFQRYVNGDKKAISASAKRGFDLFRGKAGCASCHSAPLLTDNGFHNIGVPQIGPLKDDNGRFDVTKNPDDKGRFKTPTLYNSASASFYMHDGAFWTLEAVIDHYDAGGSPNAVNQDPLIFALKLTKSEKADLVEFLNSLTDASLNEIKAPRLP